MMNTLQYYSEPGEITKLDKYKDFTNWLTDQPDAILQVVQGLIVHDSWLGQYREEYKKEHEYSQKTAYMEDLLDKALELDKSNLAIPRHPRNRVIACCREFATLMCALLRAKGIPARSRCGFATYFGWGESYEDHWICEYWNGSRWVMADPQLDPLQQSMILQWGQEANPLNQNKIDRMKRFNPFDLKPDEFLTAGQAWKLCRNNEIDAGRFGIGCTIRPEWGIDSLYGLWFVRGQLMRDFAALSKVETVPYLVRICKGLDWKPWRLVGVKDSELSAEDYKLLDEIAELSIDVEAQFNRIIDIYETNQELKVPKEIIAR